MWSSQWIIPMISWTSYTRGLPWRGSGSVKEPDLYLGADIAKWYIAESDDPGKVRWAMSSTKYTKRAISELQVELDAIGKSLLTKVTTLFSLGYWPELDATA